MEKAKWGILYIFSSIAVIGTAFWINYDPKPEAEVIGEIKAEVVELIEQNIERHSEAEYVAVYLYEKNLEKQYLFFESKPIVVPEKLIIIKPVEKLLDYHSENTCYTNRVSSLPESKLKDIMNSKFPSSGERLYLSCPIYGRGRPLGYVEMVYDPSPNKNGVIIEQNFMRYMANKVGEIFANELKI